MQAPTGTGKTLAFLLPMAVRISHGGATTQAGSLVLRGVVLAPTRELAQQIYQAAKPLLPICGIKVAAVHGGADSAKQAQRLAAGVHMLIATPGRSVPGPHQNLAETPAVAVVITTIAVVQLW